MPAHALPADLDGSHMTRTNAPESGRGVDPRIDIGRYIGQDYLGPDGSWSLSDFKLLEPVLPSSVDEVLRSRVATDAAEIDRSAALPCGAAVRLKANRNGYREMTYLHRKAMGSCQLIQRSAPPCVYCGTERVMFVYPNGTATCGICEMRRD